MAIYKEENPSSNAQENPPPYAQYYPNAPAAPSAPHAFEHDNGNVNSTSTSSRRNSCKVLIIAIAAIIVVLIVAAAIVGAVFALSYNRHSAVNTVGQQTTTYQTEKPFTIDTWRSPVLPILII